LLKIVSANVPNRDAEKNTANVSRGGTHVVANANAKTAKIVRVLLETWTNDLDYFV